MTFGRQRRARRGFLVIAGLLGILLPQIASGTGLAIWKTTVQKTGDCEVTVTVPIEIHGANATQALADQWKAEMEHMWNGPTVEMVTALGKKYGIDPADADNYAALDDIARRTMAAGGVPANSTRVDCCTVKFVFDVRVRGATPTRDFHQIEAVPAYEEKEVRGRTRRIRHRDFVMGGGGAHHISATGTWGADSTSGSAAAHEAGHLLGLDDEYEDRHILSGRTGKPAIDPNTGKPIVVGSQSKPGHELDIMSNRAPRAWPTEDGLRTILRYGQASCNCCPTSSAYEDPSYLTDRVETYAGHLEHAVANNGTALAQQVITGLDRYDGMVDTARLSWFDRSHLKARIAELRRRARDLLAGNRPEDRRNAPIIDLLNIDPTSLNPPGTDGGRNPAVQIMIVVAPQGSEGITVPRTGGSPTPLPDPWASRPGALSAWWEPPRSQDGISMFLTSLGNSSGDAFTAQFVNGSGGPVNLLLDGIVVEPMQQAAQEVARQTVQSVAERTVQATLEAFCLQPLAAPPPPDAMFRVAEQSLQEQFAGMRRVLRAAQQLQQAGQLNPDSDPATYFDSIRQWALWSRIDGLDVGSFTEAWIAHTREAAEATGYLWSDEAADTLRAAAPNRWTDIQRIFDAIQ